MRSLLRHASEADAHRAFGGAARLHAHQQVARSELRLLGGSAARRHHLATLFAFVFEIRAARVQLAEGLQAAIELASRARQGLLRDADFASDFGAFLFEAGAAQRRLLRASARGFELAEQIRVLPVSALDAGLRAIALALGIGERLAHGAEVRLHAL